MGEGGREGEREGGGMGEGCVCVCVAHPCSDEVVETRTTHPDRHDHGVEQEENKELVI